MLFSFGAGDGFAAALAMLPSLIGSRSILVNASIGPECSKLFHFLSMTFQRRTSILAVYHEA